jgi:hypothetical protein
MELPDEVLFIIRQFYQPLTRPDWRTIHRMTNLHFHLSIASLVRWDCPAVIYNLVIQPTTHFVYDLHFFDGYPYITRVIDLHNYASYFVTPKN